jgi:hypothetical protein
MENEFREKRIRTFASTRSIIDFTMGVLYLAAAFFLFFGDRFGFTLDSFDKTFRYIFASICAVYGGWRIYRGFRKDYF